MLLQHIFVLQFMLISMLPCTLSTEVNPLRGQHLRVLAMEVRTHSIKAWLNTYLLILLHDRVT